MDTASLSLAEGSSRSRWPQLFYGSGGIEFFGSNRVKSRQTETLDETQSSLAKFKFGNLGLRHRKYPGGPSLAESNSAARLRQFAAEDEGLFLPSLYMRRTDLGHIEIVRAPATTELRARRSSDSHSSRVVSERQSCPHGAVILEGSPQLASPRQLVSIHPNCPHPMRRLGVRVDRATRQALEMHRDILAAAVRSLDHDRKERIRQLRLGPTDYESPHTRDPRVAELTNQQNLLIRRIDEIDARLGVG